MTQDELRATFREVVQSFLAADRWLLEANASERAITHRLACHASAQFPDWDVDCEYNRDGELPKRLFPPNPEADGDPKERVAVFPDLIVHHRGKKENLLVVEAKKRGAPMERIEYDRRKLEAYVREMSYAHACFLEIDNQEARVKLIWTHPTIDDEDWITKAHQ
jgi:hypothetical protein